MTLLYLWENLNWYPCISSSFSVPGPAVYCISKRKSLQKSGFLGRIGPFGLSTVKSKPDSCSGVLKYSNLISQIEVPLLWSRRYQQHVYSVSQRFLKPEIKLVVEYVKGTKMMSTSTQKAKPWSFGHVGMRCIFLCLLYFVYDFSLGRPQGNDNHIRKCRLANRIPFFAKCSG